MNHKKIVRNYSIFALIVAVMVVIDQWTKAIAVQQLKDRIPDTVIAIKKILQFTYVENRGTAFGIGQGKVWLFTLISIGILAFILFIYHKLPSGKRYFPVKIITYLLAAGAIGNMIDRICLGYVVDFIEFGFVNFPVFNVADIYVTVAEVMLVVFGLFFYKDPDFERILGKERELTDEQ